MKTHEYAWHKEEKAQKKPMPQMKTRITTESTEMKKSKNTF